MKRFPHTNVRDSLVTLGIAPRTAEKVSNAVRSYAMLYGWNWCNALREDHAAARYAVTCKDTAAALAQVLAMPRVWDALSGLNPMNIEAQAIY